MKKMIAFLFVAALLLSVSACGSRQTVQPETTAAEMTEPTTAASIDDDFAMPDVNDGSMTTEPIVTQAPAPTDPVEPQPAPAPETEAQPAETQAAEAQQTETQPATTQPAQTQPVETTAALTKTSPDLLNGSVLAPINSGNYTLTMSSFTDKNKSANDKLIQSSRGSDKAYRVTIPDATLDYRVFSDNGKYYLADGSKYTELTKEQYDSMANSIQKGFIKFDNLQYEGTDEERQGLQKYTREHFTLDGADVTLWFRNKSLDHVQVKAGDLEDSMPVTVSNSADSSLFTLGSNLEQVDYETLKSYAEFTTELIFSGTQS